MAKFSQGFLRGISDFGRMDPNEPRRRLAEAAPQYKQMGTTDPLARRVGSLFGNLGVDTSYMQTGEERAQAAMAEAGKGQFASPEGRMIALLEAQLPTLRPQAQIETVDKIRQLRAIEQARAEKTAQQQADLQIKSTSSQVVMDQLSDLQGSTVPQIAKQASNLLRLAAVRGSDAYALQGQVAKLQEKEIKAVAPKDVETLTVDRVKPNGTSERWLVNKETGADIKNLGITKRIEEKTPKVSIKPSGDGFIGLDESTGVELWRTDTRSEAEQIQAASVASQAQLSFMVERDNQIAKIDKAIDIINSKGDISFFNRITVNLAQDPNSTYVSAAFPEYITLKDTVESIKASLGLDTIKELKAASATGSTGLGAVSNIELQALQSKIATLNPANLTDLPNTLEDIKRHYDNVLKISAGEMPNINWEDSQYKDYTKVASDGNRYVTTDGGKNWIKF